ncbi:hypothetical protein [Mycolicibacterium agri]|uniref:hypothetical protein n=1 Tax=Mycolicibacterium agri TaxID=36811 RepID=UPI001055C8BD|nr:hypothetical protein [Mycolicibacterium agri]
MAANMLLVPTSVVFPTFDLGAGMATLVAAVLGFFGLPQAQRLLAFVLVAFGLCALGAALLFGARPAIGQLLTLNQTLIGMLTAVSFVRLITGDAGIHRPRLTGAAAVWRTAVIVQLLGAVMNISAVTLVGDRLRRSGKLCMTDALLLSRAFSPGAFWSPFWGASAAALTYAGAAITNVLLICGGLLALTAFTVSTTMTVRAFGDRLPDYHGYPFSGRVLLLPIIMAGFVIGLHMMLPSIKLAIVVLIVSLFTSALVVAATRARDLHRVLGGHVVHGLLPMRSEAVLFTAAGMLSAGLRALLDVVGFTIPGQYYTVWFAWFSVLAMTLVALVGVHPVISIAAVASVFGPVISEPTLFALAGTIAWGTAAAVGPVSGLNVFLAGRFGVSGFEVARRNLVYLLLVIVLSLPVLALCAKLT